MREEIPATEPAVESPTRPFHFLTGQYAAAAALVVSHHYSARVPSNIQCVGTLHEDGGLFGDQGPAVAACYFTIPPTRWSEPVWELSRLVRRDDVDVPLTGLISATAKQCRALGMDLLVSFADATHGHHGGIYQAASWRYHGMRPRSCDGLYIGGAFYPARSIVSKWGTRSPDKLRRIVSAPIVPHYDDGKHLYWRPLNRRGRRKADRMALAANPYPKPAVS